MKAGDWVQPIRRGYKVACCDCGLVHRVDFRLVKTGRGCFIQFRVFRLSLSTALARGRKRPNIPPLGTTKPRKIQR